MTFAEILACAYPPGSFEGDMAAALGSANVGAVRSLHRASHKMVKDGPLVELGKGGRAGPYRYYFHPVMLVQLFEREEMHAMCEEMDRIKADAKCAQRTLRPQGNTSWSKKRLR